MAPALLEYSYTIITIVFLFTALTISLRKNQSCKKNILMWGIFGFLFNLYSLSWLYTVYPLEWIPKESLQIFGIILLHVIASLIAGLCYVIVAFSFYTKIDSRYKAALFASLLSGAEILRSFFLSLLFSGNGGAVGLHWNASTLGNALSTTPLIEYAYFGGTYALTFVLGYFVYGCLSKTNIRHYWKHLLILCGGLFAIHFFIPVTGPQTPTRVSVITTNFPTPSQEESLDDIYRPRLRVLQDMTLQLASSSPSIIVYPEDTRYTEQFTQENKASLFSKLGAVLLVDGTTQTFKEGTSNYSVFYSSEAQTYKGRGKYLLFPFNEYVPTVFMSLFTIFVKGDELYSYTKLHTYIPQTFIGTYTYQGLKIGTLICSELISFDVIRKLKEEHPAVVVYQAHLNVFHNKAWFTSQLRSFQKIAAAQLRTPLIGTVNGSPSYEVSPYGRILGSSPVGFSAKTYILYKDSITYIPQ